MKTPITNLKSHPWINYSAVAADLFPETPTRKDARNLLQSRTNISMDELEQIEPFLKSLMIESERLLKELESHRMLKSLGAKKPPV